MSYHMRLIGKTEVTAIGWGAMGISTFYGAVGSDEARFQVLDRLYELGVTNWDTAELYKDSEELIGKWFKRTGNRSKIFLATKFGLLMDLSVRADPPYIREAVERSLHRLGVEQIDLYYAHRVDSKVPIEDTVGTMAELVKEGKIKYIGLSEPSSAALRRAHAVHPIAAVQIEYSPFTLEAEDPKVGLLETARELGIAIVASTPLGRGLLTGRYRKPEDFDEDDIRRLIPRFSKDNMPKVVSLADNLKNIGVKYHATAGQICLAWLLAQGDDIIPIPGSKTTKYLVENMSAVHIKLTPDDIAAVRLAAIVSGAMEAPRYPDVLMKSLFEDSPLPQEK